MRGRLLKEEGGFTLPEVLVTMVLMLTVMFALYSIFDMSLRVFSFGNDKTEAVENARIGLERMEREVRAAYPEDRANGKNTLLRTGTDSDTIVFGNDVNGNRVVDSGEEIEYRVSADGTKLLRNGDAAVEFLQDVDGDGQALTFDYQDEQGSSVSHDVAEIVEITLEINVDGRTQTLTTDVELRNRVS